MDSLGWAGLDPAPCWDENSSLGLSIPYITLGTGFRPSQRGHEQYQTVAPDGAAVAASPAHKAPMAAPQVN